MARQDPLGCFFSPLGRSPFWCFPRAQYGLKKCLLQAILQPNCQVLLASLWRFQKLKYVFSQCMKICRCHLRQAKDKPHHR